MTLSNITEPPATSPASELSGSGHSKGQSKAHVAHHFEFAEQQFQAGKLGMWLFLVTEVLFFGGLFVAYAVYRRNHPEVFLDAQQYLNTGLGLINTIVLLFSSLTMAWGVRCAQLSQKGGVIVCLAATLACATLFLGIKSVEYSHKWEKGLLWAGAYRDGEEGEPDHAHATDGVARPLIWFLAPMTLGSLVFAGGWVRARRCRHARASRFWWIMLVVSAAYFGGCGLGLAVESQFGAPSRSMTSHEVREPSRADASRSLSQKPGGWRPYTDASQAQPTPGTTPGELTGVFFSIYYAMTGVHALHILAGIGALVWILRRALRGEFQAGYFAPVDYVGLYWHLVDLVWIFLFPLLYLIR